MLLMGRGRQVISGELRKDLGERSQYITNGGSFKTAGGIEPAHSEGNAPAVSHGAPNSILCAQENREFRQRWPPGSRWLPEISLCSFARA